MTDHPIIFSAPMVRALLHGRKTMTRRTTKPVWRHMAPGARLWVREAINWSAEDGVLRYSADGAELPPKPENYAITSTHAPSIFMPRWASRLTLTVTAVKIDRLQEITEDDARAEGAPKCARAVVGLPAGCAEHRCGFIQIWCDIHGKGAWDANPEVVALTFTVAKQNIGN